MFCLIINHTLIGRTFYIQRETDPNAETELLNQNAQLGFAVPNCAKRTDPSDGE